jgi:hypothetical protein
MEEGRFSGAKGPLPDGGRPQRLRPCAGRCFGAQFGLRLVLRVRRPESANAGQRRDGFRNRGLRPLTGQRRSRAPPDFGRPPSGSGPVETAYPPTLPLFSSGYTGRPCGCRNGFFDGGFAFGVAVDTGWGLVGFGRWGLLIQGSLGRDVGYVEALECARRWEGRWGLFWEVCRSGFFDGAALCWRREECGVEWGENDG